MKNADLPAMPFVEPDNACSVVTGLTKREMFAMAAMQGMLSYPDIKNNFNFNGGNGFRKAIAAEAVEMAGALLAELDKKEVV